MISGCHLATVRGSVEASLRFRSEIYLVNPLTGLKSYNIAFRPSSAPTFSIYMPPTVAVCWAPCWSGSLLYEAVHRAKSSAGECVPAPCPRQSYVVVSPTRSKIPKSSLSTRNYYWPSPVKRENDDERNRSVILPMLLQLIAL